MSHVEITDIYPWGDKGKGWRWTVTRTIDGERFVREYRTDGDGDGLFIRDPADWTGSWAQTRGSAQYWVNATTEAELTAEVRRYWSKRGGRF